MFMENPKKGMKNHNLSKNVLALLSFVLYGKRGNPCTIRMSSLKERPCFLPHFLINFLLSSQKIYLDSYPKSLVAWSYNLRNMVEYKDRCQVIIFYYYFGPYYSWGTIW